MLDITFSSEHFLAKRLQLEPADGSPEAKAHAVWKSHLLLGRLAGHRHYFTDYTRGCAGECSGFCTNQAPGCQQVKHRVAAALLAKDAIVWEVWRKEASDLAGNLIDFCGILRLSDVEPGCTATAHYMFFDHKLKDKTEVLQAWKEWAFADHAGWQGLRRITVQVPSNAFTLAKHAVQHLGFGGDYEYEGLPVEGVIRQAKIMDGQPLDIILLGCINARIR